MPDLSMRLAMNTGLQVWSPDHAAPIGASFACGTTATTTATSIIDLRFSGGWSIDTSSITWYRTGTGNTGALPDESNSQYITITATSSGSTCNILSPPTIGGITSPLQTPGVNAWAGAYTIPIKFTGKSTNHRSNILFLFYFNCTHNIQMASF